MDFDENGLCLLKLLNETDLLQGKVLGPVLFLEQVQHQPQDETCKEGICHDCIAGGLDPGN